MWLTLFDVGGRKLFSESIPGALEVTELLMVVVIFAGLPLVSLRGEHVVFDSLDTIMPRWLLRVQRVVIDAFCALVLALLAWRMWVKAERMMEYGDTTPQLAITLGYFVHLMAVLIGATALVHVLLMLRPVLRHHPGVDGSPSP
jgi:TRAP-type C4-dicarboxylate transport system permease small subunit